ncbi:hypothetical protein [Pedobacter deserti]|uniref:hypothetical protein n=1 Tax=Pedobacter deserti TaxID=2817382 RepID=UPI00210C4CE8|nr:hypothetical protein [Pedobacter sp. SYSU D00382]
MKKKQYEQILPEIEVVFEMEDDGTAGHQQDPTTTLATSTMTHIFTIRDHRERREK